MAPGLSGRCGRGGDVDPADRHEWDAAAHTTSDDAGCVCRTGRRALAGRSDGASYPVVDGNDLTGIFSPDGTSIIVNNTATKETRLIDAGTGGDGRVLPWTADGGTAWQRLAP